MDSQSQVLATFEFEIGGIIVWAVVAEPRPRKKRRRIYVADIRQTVVGGGAAFSVIRDHLKKLLVLNWRSYECIRLCTTRHSPTIRPYEVVCYRVTATNYHRLRLEQITDRPPEDVLKIFLPIMEGGVENFPP